MIKNMIKIITVVCVILISVDIIVLESYQTHISNPVIISNKTSYLQGENITISGWVNYNEEPTSDVLLRIIATNPLEIKIFDEYITSDLDGTFSIEIPISKNAEAGSYNVEIVSQCREIHREICTHQNETMSIIIEKESNQNKKIPDWIKNIFAWYIEDKVTEEELLGAIEFLVNQNIIQIKTDSR